jgi:hypothetical protein
MITEVQELLDRYLAWLRDKTTLRQVEDWVEITTPYLDRHNDCLQIYARKENGSYVLSDDGYVIEDLGQSGCKLDSEKRKQLLRMTLNGFGVQLKGDNSLTISATPESFAFKKHNLVQAMLAVNDLFYLAEPVVASLFYEDVVNWLDQHEIRFTPRVKFTGRSGYDHLFDFVIPKSRKKPERILQAINRPNRDKAQSVAFSWIDTKGVRTPDSQAYAILNDAESPIPNAVLDAMRNYDVKPIPWSRRDKSVEELAA